MGWGSVRNVRETELQVLESGCPTPPGRFIMLSCSSPSTCFVPWDSSTPVIHPFSVTFLLAIHTPGYCGGRASLLRAMLMSDPQVSSELRLCLNCGAPVPWRSS